MHVRSVGSSIALYQNASHHEHPCTAVVLTLAWHPFIRVDTASEAVYELVAEPIQEPQVGEQQEDAVEHASEEITNPADPASIAEGRGLPPVGDHCSAAAWR